MYVVPLVLKLSPVIAEFTVIVPVGILQVGCVTIAVGAVGAGSIVKCKVSADEHPTPLLYVYT